MPPCLYGLYGALPTTVFDVRLRTTSTDPNGMPSTSTPAGTLTGDLQHVVYTFDGTGTARVYVDGNEEAVQVVGGSFDNWITSYPLALGGELDDSRNWLGTLHLVAFYDRALSPAEVLHNLDIGPGGGDLPSLDPLVQIQAPLLGDTFTFEETVSIRVNAFDQDGTVTLVEFFAGDVLLGTDTMAPYVYDWINPAVGNHLMQAVAYDNEGNTGQSIAIPVSIRVSAAYEAATFFSDDFSDGIWTRPGPSPMARPARRSPSSTVMCGWRCPPQARILSCRGPGRDGVATGECRSRGSGTQTRRSGLRG